MKKKKLKRLVIKLKKLDKINDDCLRNSDALILKKNNEIIVLKSSTKELKVKLEETQEALSRSRGIVGSMRANKDSRSLKDMAKDMYILFHQHKAYKVWEYLTEEERECWMGFIVEILSGQKIGRG